MIIKRKIWKSIAAIILLLMFHVDVMAIDYYHFDGVDITINFDDSIAVVSLSSSGKLSNNAYPPSNMMYLQWSQMKSIQFKSVDGAAYNSND